ncbi:hypothetical protein SCUCBS95973_002220 [Sporothrix curviconia]|uniref:DNA replication checkpoint mediator MRC1 domain-containing protein n=1 Tax=Sporothrix curviconia TaxID=1260050 RepID=A0ABP0B4Z5_9PEZI
MATLSRTPSPAPGAGSDADSVVATPMTPRTKLRELFATIDGGDSSSSGSDRERESNEENITPSRKAASKKKTGSANKKSSALLADASVSTRVNTTAVAATSPLRTFSASRSRAASPRIGALNAASSDEDSDVEVRPRGRFAARMQAAAAVSTTAKDTIRTATATTEDAPADNARERVKRMLLQQASAAQAEKEKAEGDTNNDAEDEEDDAPAAARPRKRLTNARTTRRSLSASSRQSTTPTRAAIREGSSSSMFMTPSKQQHDEREASPDMFMTPQKADEGADNNAEESTAARKAKPGQNARFQALVARKREEARAREEAEERKRAARMAAAADHADDDDDNSDVAMGGLDEDDDLLMRDADGADDNPSDITDDEGGRQLTQKLAKTRPERKASKKALEEMHRETQRMSRNLQLAHEAKTRKRVTKASLFERFNFRPTGAAAFGSEAKEPSGSSRPTSPASPQNNTDTEMRADGADADTPPSSPPVPAIPDGPFSASKEMAAAAAAATATAGILPTTETKEASTTVPRVDKGKGKAVEAPVSIEQDQPKPEVKRNIRVRMSMPQTNLVMIDSDDDGELEIVQTVKSKIDLLFDNAPLKHNQEPRSLLTLRRLAQVGSPGKKRAPRPAAKNAKGASTAAELTLGELQQSLQERARLQAKREREERLEMLRAKGVRIQTEEEREKEMEEVDDIVARARQEAEELMQREREEANKDRKNGDSTNAVADPLDWDESEDEDNYEPEEEEEEVEEERDIELSGSEDEDGDENKDGDEEVLAGTLIDGEAESTDNDSQDEEDEEKKEDAAEADVLPTPTRPRPAKRRAALVISDDEDEGENTIGNSNTPVVAATPLPPTFEAKTPGPKMPLFKSPAGFAANSDSPHAPTSVLRSAAKTFIPGLPVAVGGPAGLGLTQIFAGTMADDSQMLGGSPGGFGSPSQFMPTLGNFVDVDSVSQATADVDKAAVLDSQQQTQEWIKRMQGGGGANRESMDSNNDSGATTGPSQMVQFNFSQSQAHGLDSLLREPSQLTDFLGPSQDMGPQEYTPLKVRFIEHQPSTLETVVLGAATQQPSLAPTQALTQPSQAAMSASSPAEPRRPRGRLLRKADVAKIAAEEEEEEEAEDEAEEAKEAEEEEEKEQRVQEQSAGAATAFAKMKQAAAAQKLFDRKKSKAKEMVEEQAEESEDEYAGLGGADGEDSDNESLASVKDMIDDQRVSSADNAKLAAFYADRERENDEKQVEKLFRDVTTGMLRRKRGAGGAGDYDLSDSDDGGEARRRMKRRQFARMQKALFADERVSKVASNPRNQAFLRTIEDRGSDDEMDFIFDGVAEVAATATASSASPAPAGSPAADATTSIPDSQPSAAANAQKQQLQKPQTHPRRRRLSATNGKKPANMGEIRESLSSLLEDYNNVGGNLSIVADSEFGSDGEDDDYSNGNGQAMANKGSHPAAASTAGPGLLTRRHGRSHNVQVVDRINLKRNHSSSTMSSSSSTTGSEAASTSSVPAAAAAPYMGPTGFRMPALLRRATTNSLVSNGSSASSSGNASSNSSSSSRAGGADKLGSTLDGGKIKKNASKMSGIHSFARENERRAALAESDKRRQAKKMKSAEGRSRAVGGLFSAGKFE